MTSAYAIYHGQKLKCSFLHVIKTSILENAKKSFDEYQKTLNIGSKEK